MIALTIDPPVPFLIPQTPAVTVCLVGCGGTGSHLAQALAKIAVHCRDAGGPVLDVWFIDGDQVEAKNVGRQLFSPSDIGCNKAQALAARFSLVFGLRITAIPAMATGELLEEVAGPGRRPHSARSLLVGAVDGASGRRVLAQALASQRWDLWLDCGNAELDGQVAVGNRPTGQGLHGALALRGVCTALPAPSLVYPNLLEDPPAPVMPADCAQAIADNAQALMVNQVVASVAATYLDQIIVRRRLATYRTTLDLTSLTVRSTPITTTNLVADVPGLTAQQLTAAPRKKARAA